MVNVLTVKKAKNDTSARRIPEGTDLKLDKYTQLNSGINMSRVLLSHTSSSEHIMLKNAKNFTSGIILGPTELHP